MSAAAPTAAKPAADRTPREHQQVIVEGMHCASCATRIERVLARKPGVHEVEVNYATQQATLTVDPGRFELQEAAAALGKLGYQINPVSREAEAQVDAEHERHRATGSDASA
jgi:P-type Cu+ transporter